LGPFATIVANVTDVTGASPKTAIRASRSPVTQEVVDLGFRLGMLTTEGFGIPVKVLRASADIWE
jgi:hypothetical protein